jgi:hypothetical protein
MQCLEMRRLSPQDRAEPLFRLGEPTLPRQRGGIPQQDLHRRLLVLTR